MSRPATVAARRPVLQRGAAGDVQSKRWSACTGRDAATTRRAACSAGRPRWKRPSCAATLCRLAFSALGAVALQVAQQAADQLFFLSRGGVVQTLQRPVPLTAAHQRPDIAKNREP